MQVQLVHDDFISLIEGQVPDKDGELRRWVAANPKDAVAALVHHVERDTLIFVSQFRFPIVARRDHLPLIEVVAGGVFPGEHRLYAMVREIEEEVGYRPLSTTLQWIGEFYPSPGTSTEKITLYYAPVAGESLFDRIGGRPEEGEEVHIVEIPVSEARYLFAMEGRPSDMKTRIALEWFFRNRREPGENLSYGF